MAYNNSGTGNPLKFFNDQYDARSRSMQYGGSTDGDDKKKKEKKSKDIKRVRPSQGGPPITKKSRTVRAKF